MDAIDRAVLDSEIDNASVLVRRWLHALLDGDMSFDAAYDMTTGLMQGLVDRACTLADRPADRAA